MADIEYLDQGILEETALLSLVNSADELKALFDNNPEYFSYGGIPYGEDEKIIWSDEALDIASAKLRNLASRIRVERIRQRHRGDAA